MWVSSDIGYYPELLGLSAASCSDCGNSRTGQICHIACVCKNCTVAKTCQSNTDGICVPWFWGRACCCQPQLEDCELCLLQPFDAEIGPSSDIGYYQVLLGLPDAYCPDGTNSHTGLICHIICLCKNREGTQSSSQGGLLSPMAELRALREFVSGFAGALGADTANALAREPKAMEALAELSGCAAPSRLDYGSTPLSWRATAVRPRPFA